jgi:hypothetical protein
MILRCEAIFRRADWSIFISSVNTFSRALRAYWRMVRESAFHQSHPLDRLRSPHHHHHCAPHIWNRPAKRRDDLWSPVYLSPAGLHVCEHLLCAPDRLQGAFYLTPALNLHTTPDRFDSYLLQLRDPDALGTPGITAVAPATRSTSLLEAIL